MKKSLHVLVLSIIPFILSSALIAQVEVRQEKPLRHGWESDFSPDSYKGDFYSLDQQEFHDEFVITYEDSMMRVDMDRTSWYFLHWADYGSPGIIYLKDNPIIQFDFKADIELTLTLHIQGIGSGTTESIKKTIPASDTLVPLVFDYTNVIDNLNDTITELKFIFTEKVATMYFDNFKMGDATAQDWIPPYFDDLENDTIIYPANWPSMEIDITGISDGGAGEAVVLEAFTSDMVAIQFPTIEYTSPETTAKMILENGGRYEYCDILVRATTSKGVFERQYVVEFGPNQPIPDPPVGIEDLALPNIVVFPNPATEMLYIGFTGIKGLSTISMVDFSGKQVLNETVNNVERQVYDIQDLAPGVYIITISNADKSLKEKIVIQ